MHCTCQPGYVDVGQLRALRDPWMMQRCLTWFKSGTTVAQGNCNDGIVWEAISGRMGDVHLYYPSIEWLIFVKIVLHGDNIQRVFERRHGHGCNFSIPLQL